MTKWGTDLFNKSGFRTYCWYYKETGYTKISIMLNLKTENSKKQVFLCTDCVQTQTGTTNILSMLCKSAKGMKGRKTVEKTSTTKSYHICKRKSKKQPNCTFTKSITFFFWKGENATLFAVHWVMILILQFFFCGLSRRAVFHKAHFALYSVRRSYFDGNVWREILDFLQLPLLLINFCIITIFVQ